MKGMKSLSIIVAMAFLALIGLVFLPVSVSAGDQKGEHNHWWFGDHSKASHSLFCSTCPGTPDTYLVCGTIRANEPYTLHVSASARNGNGGFEIWFQDADVMPFYIPNGSTYSISQALGGVPTVDTPRVMIVPTGGVDSMMASVLAEEGGAICTNCTGPVDAAAHTGTRGSGDSPLCTFPKKSSVWSSP
jgi:hypothetical protein